MNEMYSTMASYLQSLGLGALAGVDGSGAPSGWLWNQLQSGVDTAAELQQAIEQTDVWRNEYGVIVEQRARAGRGEPTYVMTVEEVVAYRNNAKQVMKAAGLPASFYDQASDFDGPILNGLSVAEISDRVGEVFQRTKNVDPAIRAAFEDFYGVGQGDAALAAFFLDPQKTMSQLDKQSRSAYAAGMGAKYGIGISKQTAEELTTFAPSDAAINNGLQQVAGMAGALEDGLFDSGDLSTETGVDSVFKNDALATRQINRRLTERRAVNSNSVGGAALTNQGLAGVGPG